MSPGSIAIRGTNSGGLHTSEEPEETGVVQDTEILHDRHDVPGTLTTSDDPFFTA